MKVELIPVRNYGRHEFKPANLLAKNIALWMDKSNLSIRDKEYIEMIGLEPVILGYVETTEQKEMK
jgi:hypothetical protein